MYAFLLCVHREIKLNQTVDTTNYFNWVLFLFSVSAGIPTFVIIIKMLSRKRGIKRRNQKNLKMRVMPLM